MARSLKLRVVAEGVETFKELEFLKAHQCDEAQGYYFSRPVPAPLFVNLLRAGISDEARVALCGINSESENAEMSRPRRGTAVSR
jgi:predicted signal transduction protein with EAL and GGDEF domain